MKKQHINTFLKGHCMWNSWKKKRTEKDIWILHISSMFDLTHKNGAGV